MRVSWLPADDRFRRAGEGGVTFRNQEWSFVTHPRCSGLWALRGELVSIHRLARHEQLSRALEVVGAAHGQGAGEAVAVEVIDRELGLVDRPAHDLLGPRV